MTMGSLCVLRRLRNVSFSIRKCLLQSGSSSHTEKFSSSSCWNHALSRQDVSSPCPPVLKKFHSSSRKYQEGCRTSAEPPLLKLDQLSNHLEISDAETEDIFTKDFELCNEFVSEEEGRVIFDEVEDYLEDAEYQYAHWDNAIHGYRETEKSRWSEKSQAILHRIRLKAFPSGEHQLSLVHVLDLAKDGYIKPHVDSVKFCGTTIVGLSLLSPAVMRLTKQDDPQSWVNVVLQPGSLYIMRNRVRYEFTHEILKDSDSLFKGRRLQRDRRISVMCRNEPA
ncbi:alpha-ketoglutarate-dependent dioxygenase alkB homolog 7, mitochondrial-like [Asterias rubens]|uniref:alpha-ketoglutarate-dependent dioxygenase alkB homolog 7, mitochondrial-like n=1 Tax=Asterias rubens TaxID=7604 RepID=UPI001454EBF3|nr:alpha-ketoglutarate-dependent dioxygenase alkB homolog 7, mitochondrial-like [Asterias rubens]